MPPFRIMSKRRRVTQTANFIVDFDPSTGEIQLIYGDKEIRLTPAQVYAQPIGIEVEVDGVIMEVRYAAIKVTRAPKPVATPDAREEIRKLATERPN